MADVRIIPWKEAYREFFGLAGRDWTPPATIRSAVNSARDRLSLVARFLRPDGVEVKLTTRCSLLGKSWYATEQNMELRLKFKVVP
jgi:hypothetical protein